MTQKEVVEAFYAHEMTDITSNELDSIYADIDKDDKGSVQFGEFLKGAIEIADLVNNDDVLFRAFAKMDYLKKGSLSYTHFKKEIRPYKSVIPTDSFSQVLDLTLQKKGAEPVLTLIQF